MKCDTKKEFIYLWRSKLRKQKGAVFMFIKMEDSFNRKYEIKLKRSFAIETGIADY